MTREQLLAEVARLNRELEEAREDFDVLLEENVRRCSDTRSSTQSMMMARGGAGGDDDDGIDDDPMTTLLVQRHKVPDRDDVAAPGSGDNAAPAG
jgi:phage repressor protein C with HTH and peptisase S24 domain